jgi:putative restriction endonuclease
MKAVFDTKPTSVYDDAQARHYHFPKRYLKIAQQAEHDWVVLRRPRADGGNLSYFAVAFVDRIEQDTEHPSMFYARFGDYIQFSQPVAWRTNGRYAEEELRNIPQQQVGVFLRGRSVRLVSDTDFAAIVDAGVGDAAAAFQENDDQAIPEVSRRPADDPPAGEERRTKTLLSNRLIRDHNFRKLICDAYDGQCAVSGFRFVDQRGLMEVQAAHIWSVLKGGPDHVQNGIALTATVHWLFDHHLISLTDNYELMVAEGRLPKHHKSILGLTGKRIALPQNKADWPHPSYLEKHRNEFLSGSG